MCFTLFVMCEQNEHHFQSSYVHIFLIRWPRLISNSTRKSPSSGDHSTRTGICSKISITFFSKKFCFFLKQFSGVSLHALDLFKLFLVVSDLLVPLSLHDLLIPFPINLFFLTCVWILLRCFVPNPVPFYLC
jgi:hypothetical protein